MKDLLMMKILHYFHLTKYLNSMRHGAQMNLIVYKTAERKTSVSKKKVSAQTLFFDMLKERRQKQVEFI